MFEREYGIASTVYLQLLKAASDDFAINTDWTPAAGDVQVSKDGAAFANIGTLPTYTNGQWVFTLTAAELQAKKVLVRIGDSPTKVIQDDAFVVETLNHPSAERPNGVLLNGQVQASSTATVINLPSGGITANNQYVGCLATIIDRTTRLPVEAARVITASADTGDTITVDPPFATAPSNTTRDVVISTSLIAPPLAAADISTAAGDAIATRVWAAATRTLTAAADSSGITTLLTRISAALSFTSGRVNVQVGGFDANVLTSAATDATVVTELQAGLATASALAAVQSSVDTTNTRLTTGRASALDNLDATVSSRLASGTYVAPNNASLALVQAVTDKINTMLETSGANFRFTVDALFNGPAGGGGGSADWSATEKNQIRFRLGMDGTQATPAATTGTLPDVRDRIATTGVAISAATQNTQADAVLDRADAFGTGLTLRGLGRLLFAWFAGKKSGMATGAGTRILRNPADTKTVATIVQDTNGNTTSVTTDLS